MLTLVLLDHGARQGSAIDLLSALPPRATADLFERDEVGAQALAVNTDASGAITLTFGTYDRSTFNPALRSFSVSPSVRSKTFKHAAGAARVARLWLSC